MGQQKLYGIILAGGYGTRLWPISRTEFPKQFLKLGWEYTLLQSTLVRLNKTISGDNLWVVAGNEWAALIDHQAGEIGLRKDRDIIIKEPAGSNTAPAIALAIATLINNGADDNDIMLVCPSDQSIADDKIFCEAIDIAVKEAEAGNLVALGIKPVYPETGFGYIKVKTGYSKSKNRHISDSGIDVLSFVEKPDLKTAQQYLDEGCYYWNSGIFCFRLGDMLDALVKFFPVCGIPAKNGLKYLNDNFSEIPSISIDYAVMEKAANIVCVPFNTKWSDLGSWDSVWEDMDKDERNNAIIGDIMAHDTENSLIISRQKLTAVLGVENMLIIDTPDALLVAKKGNSQKVQDFVKELRLKKRKEADQAPICFRPWGSYEILSEDKRDKVKRIKLKPGKRISLQYHKHRSEHWVIVKGTASVTLLKNRNADTVDEILLKEGESCFVPVGTLHRVENPGESELEIIEVQTGEYVGEDDIVRVDDDFKRQGS